MLLLFPFICLKHVINHVDSYRSKQWDADYILSREIDSLKENINEDHLLQVEIRRDCLLQDTLIEAQKNRFDPSKFIKVRNS